MFFVVFEIILSQNVHLKRWAAAQAGEGWSSTRLSEEDRAFAGRNMVGSEQLRKPTYILLKNPFLMYACKPSFENIFGNA